MLTSSDFDQRWADLQIQTQQQLNKLLPPAEAAPSRLHQAMRYACLNGGKRLRAILVYACGELFNADKDVLHIPACAVECMHAYSLIHDDMPAMDDDNLRRGRPTVHIEFDEGTALLAGDALQAFAIELLSNHGALKSLNTQTQLRLVSVLSKASGSQGMAGGQGIDLDSIGKPLSLSELEVMHEKKTGALICASALMGAISSENVSDKDLTNLNCFADHLGLLFQITDDILDETSTDLALGKTAGKDKADDKPTYISVLGLKASRIQAQHHHQKSFEYLKKINHDIDFLLQLNDFVLNRTF